VITIGAARLVIGERLRGIQAAGAGPAPAGSALLAAG
jgi:hypothetical protein